MTVAERWAALDDERDGSSYAEMAERVGCEFRGPCPGEWAFDWLHTVALYWPAKPPT